MKTKLLIIAFFSFIGLNMYAQIEVLPGSTRSFSVLNPLNANTFTWSFTNTIGTAITSGPTGTASNTSVTFGNTVNDAATISVIPVSLAGCQGETKTVTVVVKTTMTYTATVNSSSVSICPLTGNQPAGGDVNANLTVNGAVAGSTVTIVYTADGGVTSQIVNMTAPTANVVFDSNFTTAGGKTVTIIGIKVGALTSSANTNMNTTVSPIPSVDDIF